MTGFGLYETLRLLIPGAIAVSVLALVLRLATGEGELLGQGPFAGVLDALQGATFLFASVVAGFLLYLVDLPSRTRLLLEGDPDNRVIVPTTRLSQMLEDTPYKGRGFPLYFILSDGRLPPELHRRIYFFGGMYRIYFDLRFLTLAGVALGGPFTLAVQAKGHSELIGREYCFGVAAILVVMIAATLVGETKHAVESMRKDARKAGDSYPSRQLFRAYLLRALGAVRAILVTATSVVLLTALGTYLADSAAIELRVLGMGLLLAALTLWAMVEIGPPPVTEGAPKHPAGPVRGRVMKMLGLRPATRTQYTQLQRGLVDIALVLPPLVGAAVGAQNMDRPGLTVLYWGALAIPGSLVMAVRKHEQRLLAAYKDQVNWLEINENNIKSLAAGGPKGEWF